MQYVQYENIIPLHVAVLLLDALNCYSVASANQLLSFIDSLHAQFQVEDSKFNPLHGSDSEDRAAEEINKIFPMKLLLSLSQKQKERREAGKVETHKKYV